MIFKPLLIYIPLLLVVTTCVKPYDPDIYKYERVIVIDGILTDDGNSPLIHITYSSKVWAPDVKGVSGAVVYIMTSNGKRYDLSEANKGTYTYTQPMFPVTVGISYQLVVEHEGRVFKSTMEKPLPASPITDISFEMKSDSTGVNLLLSTRELDSASRYYVWNLTETWKIKILYFSEKRSVNKDICYTSTKDELKLGTTELFSQNCFRRFPFLNIPFSCPKLFLRYSILVEQLSISRSTYMYLNHVKKTNESGGSLFDPIPANMNGNITSESAPVIGNFQVSSFTSKRIYIDRSDLPGDLIISPGTNDCRIVTPFNPKNGVSERRNDSIQALSMVIMDTTDSEGIRYVTRQGCFDCTAGGNPNTPPEWWEEKK